MKYAAFLSLSALALAAPTPEAASQGTKVPYTRKRHEHKTRADGSVDIDWFMSTLKYTLLKYNNNLALPEILQNAGLQIKRDTDAEESLIDQVEGSEDELYYGSGNVGGQTFTFDFDTGSSDTFVPGPQCGTAQGCVGTTKYDQGGTDEHNTTSITYGSGQVTGENYFDDVTVAGLTATHQNVISLTQAQGFANSDADGLMGMAFQSIASSGQPPYFFTLVDQNKVNPTEFSFYLGREKSGTAQNSELTLGGRDASKYTGAVTPVPVTSQTYWQVAVGGASVNGGPVLPTTGGQGAIDTGTTLIIAPTVAATSIYAQIPGSVPIPLGVSVPPITAFAYPCSSSPNVSLEFAGKEFAINPLDFNFGTLNDALGLGLGNDTLSTLLGDSLCLGGIAGADLDPTENLYVVGDTFLKNWYSTFQYVSPTSAFVNFAKAV